MHAELKSYRIKGRYIALVVSRFCEFPKDFVKLHDYIARQRACAYNAHFDSGDVDVQAKYHAPLVADGGAWLGPAYP